ncbi:MAG: hypothetical protein QOE84_3208 [Actinomycetota bacterium]|nr:hypothetical protein [Actinomycetota bacterium]
MRAWGIVLLVVLGTGLTAGCGGSSGGSTAARSAAPTQTPSTAVPDIVLPADPLRELVPRTADLPTGMVAILSGSGPRDAKAVAAYSANATQAGALLASHGFRSAYVAQYADLATGRVLSVVVSRFSTAAGATADLDADLAASSGEQVTAAAVGEKSQVRRQPLPGGSGQLVTVRFRKGATTWLVAYGAKPTADPAVAVTLATTLAGRA